MGCDIHVYAERRNKEGEWEIQNMKEPVLESSPGEPDWYDYAHDKPDWVSGKDGGISYDISPRDYTLFGLLTNGLVRDEYLEGLMPNYREIPKDCSEMMQDIMTQWDCDAHTPSYFTVKELREYLADWFLHQKADAKKANAYDCLFPWFDSLKYFYNITEEDQDNCRIIFFFDN